MPCILRMACLFVGTAIDSFRGGSSFFNISAAASVQFYLSVPCRMLALLWCSRTCDSRGHLWTLHLQTFCYKLFQVEMVKRLTRHCVFQWVASQKVLKAHSLNLLQTTLWCWVRADFVMRRFQQHATGCPNRSSGLLLQCGAPARFSSLTLLVWSCRELQHQASPQERSFGPLSSTVAHSCTSGRASKPCHHCKRPYQGRALTFN